MIRFFLLAALPAFSATTSLEVPRLPILDVVAQQHGALGYAAVGLKDGLPVVSQAGGLAEITALRPITEDTAFRVASVSKVVAAMALLQQWEQKKFGLDDDVSSALGFEVRNPRHPDVPVTYRQLLSHTSSLRDGPRYFDFLGKTFSGKPPALASLKPEFTPYAPGKGYKYSNYGFGLVGALVEAHSGINFGDYASEHILKPLGMEASFTAATLPRPERLATLYRQERGGWRAQTDDYRGQAPPNHVPADYAPGHNAVVFAPHGGLRTSLLDLSKLLAELARGGGKVLKRKTVALMGEPVWVTDMTKELFALGHGLHLVAPFAGDLKRLWLGHSGDASGLHSDMYHSDDGKHGVILAFNGVKGSAKALRERMAAEVLAAVKKR